MKQDRFFVYLNTTTFPAAWAAFRGTMLSASEYGTNDFRPLAYWPLSLMKKAVEGDQNSLLRLEKELALETIRRSHYSQHVSRLHGIFVWGSQAEAERCEPKWRQSEGQHFDKDNLVEVGFSYTKLTKADTQWIDNFVLNNSVPLDWNDLNWAHSYWSGIPFNKEPHWETLLEGRAIIWGTAQRKKAGQFIKEKYYELTGMLELARLSVALGSDLYVIAPFALQPSPETIRISYYLDVRDQNEQFMRKIGEHIRGLDRASVNWVALDLLRKDQKRPSLEDLDFSLGLLSNRARAMIPVLISQKSSTVWSAPHKPDASQTPKDWGKSP